MSVKSENKKSSRKRTSYSLAEKRAYWMGVGSGANVDELVKIYGSFGKKEEESFDRGVLRNKSQRKLQSQRNQNKK